MAFMMSAETTLARSFDDLANLVERTPGLCVRIQRVDGSDIEGQVLEVGYTDLVVLDEASRKHVQVFAHELRALDVSMPRRAREWMLAVGAIPGGGGRRQPGCRKLFPDRRASRSL